MPTELIYLVFAVLVLVQAAGLLLLPETAPLRPGVLAALTPRVLAPRAVRTSLLAAFARDVRGVGALGPVRGARTAAHQELTGSSSAVLEALPIAVVGGVSQLAATLTAKLAPRVSSASASSAWY